MNLITFTGADERTDLQALLDLASDPLVEIGLLYSANPGERNRYPSMPWLLKAASLISQNGGRVAIHICGMKAREQLLMGDLALLTGHVSRVQVNGVVTPDEARAAARLVPELITQHTERNASLARVSIPNHSVLVDNSGGRGISPLFWSRPEVGAGKPFGFAGGLGPENLAQEMPRISEAIGPYMATSWIDMEGKLRDEGDWFDIERARTCLQTFRRGHTDTLVDQLQVIARTRLNGSIKGSATAQQQETIYRAIQSIKLGAQADTQRATSQALIEGLNKIKLRLCFMGWPAESFWNAGTEHEPRWVPDWRYEAQLIEHLLHGAPMTAVEKPLDTKPANEIGLRETWTQQQVCLACEAAGVSAEQMEQILQELHQPARAAQSLRARET